MNAAMKYLIGHLDRLPDEAGLDELFGVVQQRVITLADVDQFVRFDPVRYHREQVIKTDSYQILVLAWLPGQKSPIHNHRGSQCCVRVLQGTAIETVYSYTRDGFFETRTDGYHVGSILGGEDTDMHTVENAATAKTGLVTLHVYRPALTQMELFEIKENRLVVKAASVLRLS